MTASPGPFARYVALGDSSTEGLDDPIGGDRYRGWADRFAEHVAAAQSSPLLYANLAIRGRKAHEVRAEQLAAAVAMRPDLATVFAGTNDVLRRRVDLDGVAHELGTMQRALRGLGATVLTITVPDLSAVTPLGTLVRDRVLALNARLRAVAEETETLMVDLAAHPVTGDPRLWSEDRLHANAEGHRRIAAALAARLGLAGAGDEWALSLPPRAPHSAVGWVSEELRWVAAYLLPWLARRMARRSSGDGRVAKRPTLRPVVAATATDALL